MMRTAALVALLAALLLTGCGPSRTLILVQQPEASALSRTLDDQPLRQSFIVPPGGADEIELVLAVAEGGPPPATRPLNWAITDPFEQPLRSGTVETAALAHNSPIRLSFDPLEAGERLEIALTAPSGSPLSLWTSQSNQYSDGVLLNNGLNNQVDLHFSLRATETPRTLLLRLIEAANRWARVALWIPLLVLAPGWLLLWILRPTGHAPLSVLAAPVSLALAPVVYLWAGAVDLRLFEPLVKSFFQGAALALILVMLRDSTRLAAALRGPHRGTRLLLILGVTLSIATWLLAARGLLVPPGGSALAAAQMANTLVQDGRPLVIEGPLPPAAIAATVAQMTRQVTGSTLLLAALILGVTLMPSLYILGAEVGRNPRAGLWLMPLALLWPGVWTALAEGEVAVLYALALAPAALGLGLRLIRAPTPWRNLPPAALVLGALALVHSPALFALPPFAVGLAQASGDGRLRRTLGRALLWPLAAAAVIVPGWLVGSPLQPRVPLVTGALLLPTALLVAGLAGLLYERARPAAQGVTLLLVLTLPALLWTRSAPIDPASPPLTTEDLEAFRWATSGTAEDAIFLINVDPTAEPLIPLDGGGWLPLYAERATVVQASPGDDLLRAALDPTRLALPSVRGALWRAGVSHAYLHRGGMPLDPTDLEGQPWARLVFQEGAASIYELLPPPASPDS